MGAGDGVNFLPWQHIDIDASIKVEVSRFNGVSVKKFTAETCFFFFF